MAEIHTYEVLRQMDGDKTYYQGDTRELSESDAKHLVNLGVLRKAEPAAQNKSEKAPANKAAKAKESRDGEN